MSFGDFADDTFGDFSFEFSGGYLDEPSEDSGSEFSYESSGVFSEYDDRSFTERATEEAFSDDFSFDFGLTPERELELGLYDSYDFGQYDSLFDYGSTEPDFIDRALDWGLTAVTAVNPAVGLTLSGARAYMTGQEVLPSLVDTLVSSKFGTSIGGVAGDLTSNLLDPGTTPVQDILGDTAKDLIVSSLGGKIQGKVADVVMDVADPTNLGTGLLAIAGGQLAGSYVKDQFTKTIEQQAFSDTSATEGHLAGGESFEEFYRRLTGYSV